MTKFLLVTDLDNTLIGNDTALQNLNRQLSQHRQNHNTLLAYSTGRSLTRYRELQTQKGLLEPDALIVSVGTEIYIDDKNTPDSEWTGRLQSNWDRSQVLKAAQVAGLSLQPDSEQGPFKVSFSATDDGAAIAIPKIEAALQAQELDAKIIYSAGQYLDILPQRGDKGEAMQFLRHRWQISAFRTVVCGDSGNDISLFQTGAERGIIVGNAQPELLQWHEQKPVKHHYLAQEHCAAGILEGLHHFRFLP